MRGSELPKIIAICGRRRCGKDTIADFLCQEYGYTKIRIADPLKQALRHIFGFHEEQLESDQKDSIDPIWGITPRQVMQFIGTEVMQEKIQDILPHVGRKFWILSLLRAHNDPNTRYVIPDLRFLHEEEELRKHQAVIWKVQKTEDAYHPILDSHSSEQEWMYIKEHHLLHNDGNIEDLQKSISRLMPTALQRS